MTDQHPITPPPELRRIWAQQAQRMDPCDPVAWLQYVSAKAAQWGADQELEACIDWISVYTGLEHPELLIELLRAARRPKPLSLKEQALKALNSASFQPGTDFRQIDPARSATIRRALEQLDD